MGIENALKDVKEQRTQEVPAHLKGTGYSGAKRLDRGKDYKYAHDYKDHFVEQEYMPEGKTYYIPGQMGYEKDISERLGDLRKKHKK
jgi:putative ATPase